MRRVPLVLLGLALVAAVGLAVAWRARPPLSRWDHLVWRRPPEPAAGPQLTVTFLGVSSLLFRDGETALLTDGFFSRPPLRRVLFGRIAPDPERIDRALARAGVERLAAVVVVHSHYDHAMDAPEVARRTGALLVGSESTANVGRGLGLAEERIRVPAPGEPLRFGAFRVRLVPSRHVDFGWNRGTLGGAIREPLVPPARAAAWAEGTTYSVLLEHPLGSALVQGSAGFVPGALAPYAADVVFLGVGGLGLVDDAQREGYFREVVDAVGARRVIPLHYDDFTRPLDEPLRTLPGPLADLPRALRFLEARVAERPGRSLALLPVFEPVVLFEGR